MDKVAEFFTKAAKDETAKEEFWEIVGDRKPDDLTDSDFEKLSGFAKKLGFDIMVEDLRSYLTPSGDLSDDALGEVAGGCHDHDDPRWYLYWGPFLPYWNQPE